MILIGVATWKRQQFVICEVLPAIQRYTVSDYQLVVSPDSEEAHQALWQVPGIRVLGTGCTLGVAGNKNRILAEFARDKSYTHCFLFEDDTWPIKRGWDAWYIEGLKATGVHAVCFQPVDFYRGISRQKRPVNGHQVISTKIDGMMMLAITRTTIDTIGGFHEAYKRERYGNEHSEYMGRAAVADLIPFTNATLAGCEKWIDGIDYMEFRGIPRPADDPNGGKLLFAKYQPHGLAVFGAVKKTHRKGKLYQSPVWPEEPKWNHHG